MFEWGITPIVMLICIFVKELKENDLMGKWDVNLEK
jgi:hypothetical protein